MSSATQYDPSLAKGAGNLVDFEKMARLGMSPRQQELNHLYAFYRCQNYDARRIDWDGREHVDGIDREAIARGGFIPPGFYDAGATFPLKWRRPSAPYNLARVIVDRFTGLLFSERRHPQLRVPGDPATEDYATALAESGRLWQTMIQARAYGGAMGSVAVGFQFIDGKPVVEAHDPRWCIPVFSDRASLKLKMLEKRYMFPVEERDPQTGAWVNVMYWYRRVLDENYDVVWKPQLVGDGSEPNWGDESTMDAVVEHNLGFCPVVWVQNQPLDDSIDGDPDCHGVYDMIESIDALLSQANRGILANCFSIDTPFITPGGVSRFSRHTDGETITVLGHSGAWREARVRNHGKQQLWSVTLTRGSQGKPLVVQATRNHRWMLADGTTTESLEVGDRLLSAPSTFSSFEYDRAHSEEKLAWCRGFVWGDGSVARGPNGKAYGCKLRLCGEKAAYAPRFQECGFKVWSPEYVNGDVMAAATAIEKELPGDGWSVEMLRAFARGYVDADATKRKRNDDSSRWNRIQVTGQASIEFVRRVFPAVGLYISCETDMTAQTTNYGPRTATTVRFELNENGSNHPNSLWRVAAIEPIDGPTDVWCLEVEQDRSFSFPFGVVTGNCDPTVLISTTDQLSELTKGSDNALKLTNGTASYMEISGSGPKAALELAESLRSKVLEVAQCILDRPDSGGAQTATEIERAYSSMLSKADIMREQYGERCVKPLMEMMVAAARKATRAVQSESGITRGALVLPAKISQLPDGTTQRAERKLGPGGALKLTWPGYFEPTLTDASQAVGAAGQAKGLGLVDDEHAVKFVAEYFHVEDVSAMVAKMQAAAQAQQDSYGQQSLGELGGGGEYAEEPPPEELAPDEAAPESPDDATKVPLPMTDIKLGVEAMEAIVTVNEARQSVGLDILYKDDGSADPDGDLSIAKYKVKNASLVAAATNATAGEPLGEP